MFFYKVGWTIINKEPIRKYNVDDSLSTLIKCLKQQLICNFRENLAWRNSSCKEICRILRIEEEQEGEGGVLESIKSSSFIAHLNSIYLWACIFMQFLCNFSLKHQFPWKYSHLLLSVFYVIWFLSSYCFMGRFKKLISFSHSK